MGRRVAQRGVVVHLCVHACMYSSWTFLEKRKRRAPPLLHTCDMKPHYRDDQTKTKKTKRKPTAPVSLSSAALYLYIRIYISSVLTPLRNRPRTKMRQFRNTQLRRKGEKKRRPRKSYIETYIHSYFPHTYTCTLHPTPFPWDPIPWLPAPPLDHYNLTSSSPKPKKASSPDSESFFTQRANNRRPISSIYTKVIA